jgi:hypothetical protein
MTSLQQSISETDIVPIQVNLNNFSGRFITSIAISASKITNLTKTQEISIFNLSCYLGIDFLGFPSKTLTLPSPTGEGETVQTESRQKWGEGRLLKSR